ncbi:hypothetical protein A1O3_06074 [Capronia epimyces CBS 606.96]|uniref:Uncharacterized protein n=1 Tax=Capronia epimyces CBS 606.96 TaxID=1182542 RepID=W9XZ59_9EURO|nr:uncharacterized protein A1O3_06074 [Capronia epimyces CBS 606.96]EXJ82261.1 hypothetical protein A1O3_06074 [Capronia epimyces CBS 606.96]
MAHEHPAEYFMDFCTRNTTIVGTDEVGFQSFSDSVPRIGTEWRRGHFAVLLASNYGAIVANISGANTVNSVMDAFDREYNEASDNFFRDDWEQALWVVVPEHSDTTASASAITDIEETIIERLARHAGMPEPDTKFYDPDLLPQGTSVSNPPRQSTAPVVLRWWNITAGYSGGRCSIWCRGRMLTLFSELPDLD